MKVPVTFALLLIIALSTSGWAGFRQRPVTYLSALDALVREDFAAAEAAFSVLITQSPGEPDIWQAFAASLDGQDRREEAADAYRRAVESYCERIQDRPEDANAHANLVICLLCSAHREEASAALAEGLRLNPNDSSLLGLKGAFNPEGR